MSSGTGAVGGPHRTGVTTTPCRSSVASHVRTRPADPEHYFTTVERAAERVAMMKGHHLTIDVRDVVACGTATDPVANDE